MTIWLDLHALLVVFDYVATGESKGWPHSGMTSWEDWVRNLYPGQWTLVTNTASAEVVGSVVWENNRWYILMNVLMITTLNTAAILLLDALCLTEY